MAYKKRIVDVCYNSYCKKEARWEVFDRWNSSVGKFCRTHADDKVAELQGSEGKLLTFRHRGPYVK